MKREKIEKFILQRKLYFEKLRQIYPERFFYVAEDKENIGDPTTRFNPANAYEEDELASLLNLHREILPNEIVIEIESENWEDVVNEASLVIRRLEEFGIPYYIWFSGGKSLHIHIFIDYSLIKQHMSHFKKIAKHYYDSYFNEDDLERLISRIINSIAFLILEGLKLKCLDKSLLRASMHQIRAEGSFNIKDGKVVGYKTYVEEIPAEKPKVVCSWNVKFPDEIKTWKPEPEFFKSLIYMAYWHYIRKPIKLEGYKGYNKTCKIDLNKLGEILQDIKASIFKDYRKRLFFYFIAPAEAILGKEEILKNKDEWIERKAKEWWAWFERNKKAYPSDGRKYYFSQVKCQLKWWAEKILKGEKVVPHRWALREALEWKA